MALFLPAILWLGESELQNETRIAWYFWASTIVSSPHVYSTYVRQCRKTREGKVSWLWGAPAYVACVLLLAAASAAGFFVETITAVNVWQSFHYLRQTYGVGCLYGRQESFDDRDRKWRWWAYHLCFPWFILGRWDTLHTAWGGRTYDMIPVDVNDELLRWLGLLAACGAYLQLCAEVRLWRRNGRNYRPTGLACYAVFLAIHYYGFMRIDHFQRGFFAVTIFHAVQYLALVWVLERRHNLTRGTDSLRRLPNLAGFALFWATLFLLGFGWEQKVTLALEHWWLQASTLLLAGVSVHHYTVDSFLWRRDAGL